MPPIPPTSPPLPRLIMYYQTHHTPAAQGGTHISILPLIMQPGIHLTHLILAAIHINEDPSALTLNDHHPSHPRFDTLWAELRILQASGVKVLGMLGGAAKGSYTRLDASQERFERYYAPLASLVRERGLDGLDLDVEEEMSLPGIIRLVDRLRADFGEDFIITLAPVAAALVSPRHNLSGFDYAALERERGREIAWYNAQFYCGWGDCSNPAMYEMILLRGWRKDKIVVGLVTSPENGSGWVPWEVFGSVVPLMRGKGEGFGGVMGWEYFNGLPGGREKPWEWARGMTGLLRGQVGEGTKWDESGSGSGSGGIALLAHAKEKGSKPVDEDEGEDEGKPIPVPRDFDYYSDAKE
ncbi:glycoside hydrolase [Cladorrhinum sp. PSN332]|nr:glycoside hydrolase [Cladorrhinum sp. PSN332]